MSDSEDIRPEELPFPPIPEGSGPEGGLLRSWALHATHYLKWLVKSNAVAHKKLDRVNKNLEDLADALKKYIREEDCNARHKILDEVLGAVVDEMDPIRAHVSSEGELEMVPGPPPDVETSAQPWYKLLKEKISFVLALISLLTVLGGGWLWSVKQATNFKTMVDTQNKLIHEVSLLKASRTPAALPSRAPTTSPAARPPSKTP